MPSEMKKAQKKHGRVLAQIDVDLKSTMSELKTRFIYQVKKMGRFYKAYPEPKITPLPEIQFEA